MDPNKAVEDLEDAIGDGDLDAADDLFAGLMSWKRRGGFEPSQGWGWVGMLWNMAQSKRAE